MPDNYGVITEQGYVAGNGLGFNPLTENELNKNKDKEENTKKTDK